MPIETYEQLNAEAMRYYGERNFEAVYDLLTKEGDRFPANALDILYLRSCMAARMGNNDHAIALIREVADRGLWYGEYMMRNTPSWPHLQGLPAFEELAALFKGRMKEAYVGPRMVVVEPEGGCSTEKPCPTLISLHGNDGNAEQSLRAWQSLLQMGWLHAALQSSQIAAPNAFIWDEQEVALGELKDHYAALKEEHSIDTNRVVLAGFSMGGETALRAALLATVPIEGFILLGPGGPTTDGPEGWLPLLQSRPPDAHSLRGYVFLGEHDDDVVPDAIRRTAALLNEHGIPCKLEEIPGIRHEYPQDFAPYIKRALAFIEG